MILYNPRAARGRAEMETTATPDPMDAAMERYRVLHAEWRVAYDAWKAGGKQGPPPPMPIKPHIPGWRGAP